MDLNPDYTPTCILASNFINGKIYQLWKHNHEYEKHEWRPLPELADAKNNYGGRVVT